MKLLFTLAFGSSVLSAGGQPAFLLDTTFRTVISEQNVNSLMFLDDGDLVISGRIKFPGDQAMRLGARLNPDGTRDENFSELIYWGGASAMARPYLRREW